jgi:hypothetical protein
MTKIPKKKKYSDESMLVGQGTRTEIKLGDGFCELLTYSKSNKLISKQAIEELAENELNNFKRMGTAEGIAFSHCLWIASRFAKNFFKRVRGYRFTTPQTERCTFAVDFFEEKINIL